MLKREIIKKLKSGKVCVMPSDTIYGLMCQALNKDSVESLYKIRQRSPDKPSIVLISKLDDLELFDIKVSEADKKILSSFWPGAVSVVLPCVSARWRYLHRGTETLALRLPDKKSLLEILRQTGPLIAPSANPEGSAPAKNIKEAKKYFGDRVFYYGRGDLTALPSTLVSLSDGKLVVLRQGAVKVKCV